MEISTLKNLIKSVEETTTVGLMFEGWSKRALATAGYVSRLIGECSTERVAVEEQDHSSYVIHLSNEPVSWLVVLSESPIFAELRKLHVCWVDDHPKWTGWIAF